MKSVTGQRTIIVPENIQVNAGNHSFSLSYYDFIKAILEAEKVAETVGVVTLIEVARLFENAKIGETVHLGENVWNALVYFVEHPSKIRGEFILQIADFFRIFLNAPKV